MSFGLEFTNNFGAVTISSKNTHLVFAHRGTVRVRNTSVVDRPASGTVTFPVAIRTQSPPSVFVKVNSSNFANINIYMYFSGTAGNWTGFTIMAGAQGRAPLPDYTFDWVCCKFADVNTPRGGFGLELYDENGAILYHTNERLVRFNKFTLMWTQEGVGAIGANFIVSTPVGVTVSGDEYICISSINRSPIFNSASDGGGAYTGIDIWKNSAPNLQLQTQFYTGSLTPNRGVNTIKFCMPICKFPVSDYPL